MEMYRLLKGQRIKLVVMEVLREIMYLFYLFKEYYVKVVFIMLYTIHFFIHVCEQYYYNIFNNIFDS